VPLLRIAVPIGDVLFPAFSRLQDDRKRLAAMWMRGLRLLAAVVMPAIAGLVVVAPDFVPLVLGDRWQDAVPVVQILAVVGLFQALDAWNGPMLMGLGQAKTLFRCGLLFYSVFIASYVIGLPWGIVGVAASYATAIVLMQVVYQRVTTRAVGIPLLEPLRAISGVSQATALMLVALVAARVGLVHEGVPAAARLPILIVLGTVAYLAACRWRAPEVVGEVAEVLRRRRSSRAPGAVPEPVA
jgi:O-antigen/teichoic acid export membrane protein